MALTPVQSGQNIAAFSAGQEGGTLRTPAGQIEIAISDLIAAYLALGYTKDNTYDMLLGVLDHVTEQS